MIMFGGSSTGKSNSFGDLFKFCTKSKVWQKLEVPGETPPPREAHICQVIENIMILHGGLNYEEESFDDMWALIGLTSAK